MSQERMSDPLETHRYRLNQTNNLDGNPELGGNAKAFRTLVEELISKHPEVIGATLYGSQNKGLARTESSAEGKSDIDSYIYIDGDVFNGDLDQLSKEFKDLLSDRMSYTDSATKDIRFRILTKASIDAEIDSFIAWENKPSNEKSYKDAPSTSLGHLFHMQLGKGLDSYRAYILQRLKNVPDGKGEEIWRTYVANLTSTMEVVKGKEARDVNIARDKNNIFPQTLDDAIKIYALKDVTPRFEII